MCQPWRRRNLKNNSIRDVWNNGLDLGILLVAKDRGVVEILIIGAEQHLLFIMRDCA